MKRRLRPTLALAAIAGLLALWTFALKRPTSYGYLVAIPLHTESAVCADSRDTVVFLSKSRSVEIDGQPIDATAFGSQLERIYRRQVERVMFLKADPELEFQEVVSLIGRAKHAVPNLHIGIVTPAVEKEPCLAIPYRPQPLPLPES